MRKWMSLLMLALLFSHAAAAPKQIFFTNHADRYYHADTACDRPAPTDWYNDVPREIYEREVYQKYEISAIAAEEFGKKPCPVCVRHTEAVYLGDHLPEWNDPVEPWRLSGTERREMSDNDFRTEVAATHQAFEAYFEEYAEYGTGEVKRRHPYPASFAEIYKNVQGSYSYMFVDPDQKLMQAFKDTFGGGAWIVPAKYGYDEIYQNREHVFQTLIQWEKDHPELDACPVFATGDGGRNCAIIGIHGDDWQLAAAAMEEIAPIYIHFVRTHEWVNYE